MKSRISLVSICFAIVFLMNSCNSLTGGGSASAPAVPPPLPVYIPDYPLPGGLRAVSPRDATYVVLGLSRLEVVQGKPMTVGIQVDRGTRDIAWTGSAFDIRTDPARIPESGSQLVPYMEGARAAELMDWGGARVRPMTPGLAMQGLDGKYYGSDGKGGFSFHILDDKIAYKTVTFMNQSGRKFAIIPDTHGFNSIAGPAMDQKKKGGLDLAIACMDDPAKAAAALYLATEGISCYAPCDRFASTLLEPLARNPGMKAVILGSAPVRKTPQGAVIGAQPVVISLSEPIVAQTTDQTFPGQYYDTPARYFRELSRVYGLALKVSAVKAATGETSALVQEAEKLKANVIAARIYVRADYEPLKRWLDADRNRRLVLFHTAGYEYGISMYREYPDRTTFGDLRPVFARL